MQRQRLSIIPTLLLCTALLFSFWLTCFSLFSPSHAQPLSPGVSTAAPDLLIADVTVSPIDSSAGGTGNVTVTVQNGGDMAAAGFWTYLYVDPADVPPIKTTPATLVSFADVALLAGDVFTWTLINHRFADNQPQVYVWVDPPWENAVAESNEGNNLFPRIAVPAVTAVEPDEGKQGATLDVTVSATNTQFVPNTTIADLGAGVTIAQVNVVSNTQVLLQLTVEPDAKPGPRTLTLTTGAEIVSKRAAFAVVQETMPVAITAIDPARADPGSVLTVTVTASNTHFVNGRTDATFGAGITISNVQVISPTQAVVNLAVAADAAPGLRTVTLTTGTELATEPDGFRVNVLTAEGGAVLYVDPTPATLFISETSSLAIVLAPGVTPVNGFQIHGKVDPAYLRLTEIISHVTPLVQTLSPLQFDPATGEFQYSAGELGRTITETLTVLTLQVLPLQKTDEAGTPIEFLSSFPATDISGISGSVMEAAYDGRVTIAEHSNLAQLKGRVDLQGRPFRPQAAWSIGVTVELIPADQPQAPRKQIVRTDERGEFSIEDLPVGTYTVRVKGEHTLANRVENVTLDPGLNEIYLGTLLEGDVETETSYNRVVVQDFSLVSGSFHHCRSDDGFLPNADLNEDGCVTIEDSTLVYANFNQKGDMIYDYRDGIPAPLPFADPSAEMRFATTNTVAAVGEVVVLPLYVDPKGGDPILGMTVELNFDPSLIEVVAYNFAAGLADRLMSSTVDNNGGTLHFSLQLPPDEGIQTRFQVATIQVRLKATTGYAPLAPAVDGLRSTNLVGSNGSLLATATGIMLVSDDFRPDAHRVLLPFVSK